MAAFNKSAVSVFLASLAAVFLDIGYDFRLPQLMGVPITTLSPITYRGLTGWLVALSFCACLAGALHYRMTSNFTSDLKRAFFTLSTVVGCWAIYHLISMHALPTMEEVATNLVVKVTTPSNPSTIQPPPTSTGAIPGKRARRLPAPPPEKTFFEDPFAWLKKNTKPASSADDKWDQYRRD